MIVLHFSYCWTRYIRYGSLWHVSLRDVTDRNCTFSGEKGGSLSRLSSSHPANMSHTYFPSTPHLLSLLSHCYKHSELKFPSSGLLWSLSDSIECPCCWSSNPGSQSIVSLVRCGKHFLGRSLHDDHNWWLPALLCPKWWNRSNVQLFSSFSQVPEQLSVIAYIGSKRANRGEVD